MRRWLFLASCLELAGCAALGGNVRGDFVCKAPQGTCAPTAEIDARAVDQVMARQSEAPTAPAARAWAPRTVAGGTLERKGERVLRIIFYPRIDEAGHFHERAVVQAVVEGSGWQEMPARRVAEDEQAPTQPTAAAAKGTAAEAAEKLPGPSLPDVTSGGRR